MTENQRAAFEKIIGEQNESKQRVQEWNTTETIRGAERNAGLTSPNRRRLPPELWHRILERLTLLEITAFQSVSAFFRDLVDNYPAQSYRQWLQNLGPFDKLTRDEINAPSNLVRNIARSTTGRSQTLLNQVDPVGRDLLSDLQASAVSYPNPSPRVCPSGCRLESRSTASRSPAMVLRTKVPPDSDSAFFCCAA